MDISLYQGAASLVLNGSGIASPFRAARFTGADLNELEVVFEATAANITLGISTLQWWMNEAERSTGETAENWVYLKVTLPDGTAWRSPVYGEAGLASVRGPLGRKVNNDTVLLKINRGAFWESETLSALTLTNQHQATTTGLLYNHDDGGNDNWATLSAVAGDLPAPVQLTCNLSGLPNGEVWLGISSFSDLANLTTFFEGESATSGAGVVNTTTGDAGSSSANYGSKAWNGSAIVTLGSYSLSQAVSSAYGGRFFRPFIRLFNAVGAVEKFWCQIKLGYDAAGTLEIVYESEPILIPDLRRLIPFPTVQLPPWPTLGGDSQPCAVMLTAWAEAAGAHTLTWDYLSLIPMDSFIHFIPKILTYPDTNLTYDTEKRLLKNNARSMGTHIAEGEGLYVFPGRPQKIFIAVRNGTQSVITHLASVQLSYRVRRAAL